MSALSVWVWLVAAKSPGFLPESVILPEESSPAKLPAVGEDTLSALSAWVWLAAAKSLAFLPESVGLPEESSAAKLPSVGEAAFCAFSLLSVLIFSCIAVWSAAVKYRPITSPADHARAVVPFCARVTVSTFPLLAVISTVSAVEPSAPIVSKFGASGNTEPSTTFTVVPAAVSAPEREVSGEFACAGYIVSNSDIFFPPR